MTAITTPDRSALPVRWDERGLAPAIVQEARTGEVLMLAWMNAEALEKTLDTGEAHFYSRSRQALWHKGGTSGHVQRVQSIHVDCDADAVLVRVHQVGGACHEGYFSCFSRRLEPSGLLERVASPVFEPQKIYPQSEPNPDASR